MKEIKIDSTKEGFHIYNIDGILYLCTIEFYKNCPSNLLMYLDPRIEHLYDVHKNNLIIFLWGSIRKIPNFVRKNTTQDLKFKYGKDRKFAMIKAKDALNFTADLIQNYNANSEHLLIFLENLNRKMLKLSLYLQHKNEIISCNEDLEVDLQYN